MTETYYDTSYPPSLWNWAKGATAGTPGSFTPAGSIVPKSVADLAAGNPVPVIASPATPWTSGQYVQTATAGTTGRASWSGTNWVGGAAPLEGEAQEAPQAPVVPQDATEQPQGTETAQEQPGGTGDPDVPTKEAT